MRILIIEDEKHTAFRLQELLRGYNKGLEVIDILTSVTSSIAWFNANNHPDLIFQDIELSDGQCFEIYQKTDVSTPVIFTTAYSEYALKAFEVHSIDYLVKPYDANDIKRVMDKFMNFKHLFQYPGPEMLENILHGNNKISKKRFLIRIGDNYKSLNSKDIAYFITEEGLTFAYTFEGKRYPISQTLNELVVMLDKEVFFRINRNCIVNHQSIEKIAPWFNSRLKLILHPKPGNEIIVSRDRAKDFKIWMGA